MSEDIVFNIYNGEYDDYTLEQLLKHLNILSTKIGNGLFGYTKLKYIINREYLRDSKYFLKKNRFCYSGKILYRFSNSSTWEVLLHAGPYFVENKNEIKYIIKDYLIRYLKKNSTEYENVPISYSVDYLFQIKE